jgi:hypothetical protein
MAGIKSLFNHRLTPLQCVIVVVAIAGLGGLGYFSFQAISAKILESKVNAELPKVCAGVREQRDKIVIAIEHYKQEFGFYPPDHVATRQPLVVNAYTNPLLYELAGTVIDTNGMVDLPGLEQAEITYVKRFFQTTGFVNSASSPDHVKHFFNADPSQVRQLHDDPDVFAIGHQIGWGSVSEETFWQFEIGPWQYVTSSPTHNSGKFDLWIEVKTKTRTVVIGNWKEVE